MREKTKQTMKKMMAILLALVVSGSTLMWNEIPVCASMADEAIEYTMGETYRGEYGTAYYCFTLKQKSHICLNMQVLYGVTDVTIYGANGKKYLVPDNVTYTENATTEVYTGTASRTLGAGTYYLEIRVGYTYGRKYYFNLQAENPITLSKGVITSLKSKKSGQMTVSCQSVKNAIGYRIQYSTDYRFKKGVKTVYSPTRIKTLTKLGKKKRYYVKVTPYTVYSDGGYAWGGTSYVKSAVVK